MRARGIFLVRDGQLVVLSQEPYEQEDLFQAALAQFPEVLAGGTTAEDGDVRKLLLVSREMGVPSTEGGSANFSLDHLFLDEAGVPVFVEVKRSSDTRIRREVVGQMLDYAANGSAYWSVQDLQHALEGSVSDGKSADQVLGETFEGVDAQKFWKDVERNLNEGKVRLVFVADRLPPELVRIIEFLNERMHETEVLGVEVTQYLGEGHQLFVPELVGRTARAVTTKGGRPGRQWDEDSFLATTRNAYGELTAALFKTLFDHVRQRKGRFSWGKGIAPGVSGWYPINGEQLAVWTVNSGVYGEANDAPSLFIYPSEIKERVKLGVFEQFIAELDEIEPFKKKLSEARLAGWSRKYPSCLLTTVATSEEERYRLLAAFAIVADDLVPEDSVPGQVTGTSSPLVG